MIFGPLQYLWAYEEDICKDQWDSLIAMDTEKIKIFLSCLFGVLELVFLWKLREDGAVWEKKLRGFGSRSSEH